MDNKRKSFGSIHEFYNYIKRPLDDGDVRDFYSFNNVKKELIKIINDFIFSLIDNIHSTYLGEEYIKSKDDIEKHFEWCFNKIVNDFKKEEYHFDNNQHIKAYFYDYFLNTFYQRPQIIDNDESLEYLNKENSNEFDEKWATNHWNEIFTYNTNKTEHDLDTMLTLYKMFESCLIKC